MTQTPPHDHLQGRPARTAAPLLPAIAGRWSPRAFDPAHPLTEAEMLPLLEAARWAASANNLQPWRLAWALPGEAAFTAILGCLNPGNAAWAQHAGALMIGCAVLSRPDGTPNRHALHDLGQGLAQLAVQAMANGIGVHQIAGFDAALAAAALRVPEGVLPFTAMALGWPADHARLDPAMLAREMAPRQRRPLSEIAPRGGWPAAAAPLEAEPEHPRP